MMNRTAIKQSHYKWYALTLAALTHTFVVAIPTMAMPVLFKEISIDLGLSLVQIGTIWGLGSLTGLIAGLLGGSMGDRFGAKRTLTVACLLCGLAGGLRGLAIDFNTLAVTMLLFGFMSTVVPMNVHKTCGIWFTGRNLGLANGVVAGGMALGFTVGSLISATVMSPWLGGWRNVLFCYGLIAMAMSILWAFARPGPEDDQTASYTGGHMSMRQGFGRVVRLRHVWLLGLGILGVGGCVQGTLGYLPLYLRDIGWPVAQADGALATFHAVSLVGVLPVAILSDRLGTRKKILMAAALSIAAGVGLLAGGQGPAVWVAVVIAGFFRDGFMAIFFTSVIEAPGVGAVVAGTAMGFTTIFLRFGNMAAPPIGNSLAALGSGAPFAFWATLAVLGLICFSFVKEASPQPATPVVESKLTKIT